MYARMYTADVAKPSATYRLDRDLLATVRVLAAECGDTVTDAVTWGLRAYIRSKEAPLIEPTAPVAAPTVHTPYEAPAAYAEVPERRPCRHPADRVDAGVCQECGEDVW